MKLAIFAFTEGRNLGRPDEALAPVFIGLTVTFIICCVAPLTQAGLNPAHDLGPRLVVGLLGLGLRRVSRSGQCHSVRVRPGPAAGRVLGRHPFRPRAGALDGPRLRYLRLLRHSNSGNWRKTR